MCDHARQQVLHGLCCTLMSSQAEPKKIQHHVWDMQTAQILQRYRARLERLEGPL